MSITEAPVPGFSKSSTSDRGLIAMELAGTVPVPSPFPALGRISVSLLNVSSVELEDLSQASSSDLLQLVGKLLLEVVHQVNPRLTITRLLKLTDVAALFVPDNPRMPEVNDGK